MTTAIVGIVEAKPSGTIAAEGGWAVIGTVILNGGEVRKVPRRGLSSEQSLAFDAASEAVWLHGRDALRGWRFHPRIGWLLDVRVAIRPR